jgi:hypothetical protein
VPYSIDIATLLAVQIKKFVTLNPHQLVGHVANLDFWIAEVGHCLKVIDGYQQRFERLKTAQTDYVSRHRTTAFDLDDSSLQWDAPPPQRVPGLDLKTARRDLCEAIYQFLVRCARQRLIDESTLRAKCGELGISVDAADLRK